MKKQYSIKKLIIRNFLKLILLVSGILNVTQSFGQVNIWDKETTNNLEDEVINNLMFSEIAYRSQLMEWPDGAWTLQACSVGKLHEMPVTTIGLRLNTNLFYTLIYAVIMDKDGFATENVYVGYTKLQFGEQKTYLIKVKKTRLLVENNIFTERILFPSGISVIIENRLWVSEVRFPKGNKFSISNYSFVDCPF